MVSECAQMLDLADKAFKAAIKNMFKELKETMFKQLKESVLITVLLRNRTNKIKHVCVYVDILYTHIHKNKREGNGTLLGQSFCTLLGSC